jgi:two-component system, sensor histidine kinase PdtaS
LLLYVRVRGVEAFEICAQLRPFTAQTLYPNDLVGLRVTQPEQPVVERAFREGQIWDQQEPVLVDGVPIRMDAVPVRLNGKVLAVLTKEGSPATSRRPGRLERVYLEAADRVSKMICDGRFPWPDSAQLEWPRVGDGLFALDATGRIAWASPNAMSALRRLGVRENVDGLWLDDLGFGETPVRQALASLRPFDGELVRGETYVSLMVLPLVDEGGLMGALALARDVSEVRQKERLLSVKDATIREIHHRVKNNLQTIASLLRLQGRRLDSEEARAALQESGLRIGSIALVHETLSEDLTDVVDFGAVARRISKMMVDGLLLPERHVAVAVTGSTGTVSSDIATPLAVALTELLQNSLEHAFPDGRTGTVAVQLAQGRGEISVVVADDGVGMPEGALDRSRLGLNIVRSLVGELGGSFAMTGGPGTRIELRIPTAPVRGSAPPSV